MSLPPLITLTTDFGVGSPYVAAMKGVILSMHPAARIVDVTHAIRPQNVGEAAWVLLETAPYWPPGSIHVAVVDPGVGTARRLLCAVFEHGTYLVPDNGLLTRLAGRRPPTTIVALTDRRYWLPEVSATFHGRDILAPTAARLSLGLDPLCLGPAADDWVRLSCNEVLVMPGKIQGEVRSIDSFGNLVTDIPAETLANVPTEPDRVRIRCGEHETQGLFRTYDQPPMTLLALIGSSGYLELAIVEDSAAAMLGVRAGTSVTVEWT